MLDGLLAKEPDQARQAALRIRATIKEASGNERRSYRAQLEKFIKRDDVQKVPHSLAAGLKILAFLEDEKTLPTLLEYATDESRGVLVRSEATIGLRFALKGAGDDVLKALINVAHDDERVLAQTALDTLATIEIPDKHLKAFAEVATHRDLVRSSFVIRGLGLMPSKKAAQALVQLLPKVNLRRTELIKDALEPRVSEVSAELVKAMLSLEDSEKTLVIAKLLARAAKDDKKLIKPAQKKQIAQETIKRLKDGSAGWEALIQVARETDSEAIADGLRDLAQKQKRAKKIDKAISTLTLLKKTEGATPDDGYKLASLLLLQSRQDTSPTARSRDSALVEIEALAKSGYDVLSALKKDKALDNKALFYVGFHFAEKAHILGEELLEEVVKKGGRTKIAKMAKNKLALVQE